MMRLGLGVARYRPTQITPVVLDWLLQTGFWNDFAKWDDGALWID
jgi:hypothetical protein